MSNIYVTSGVQQHSTRTRMSDWLQRHGGGIALISLLVSLLASYYARQQTQIAQYGVDRPAGRIPARLRYVGVQPDLRSVPDDLLRAHPITRQVTPYFVGAKTLIELDYRILIGNDGEEPIDAIKLVVEHVGGWGPGELRQKPEHPNFDIWRTEPVLLEKPYKEEVLMDRALARGETVSVQLSRALLEQISRINRGGTAEASRLGRFVVRCYGRIAGSPTFPPQSDDLSLPLDFQWAPMNFTPERGKELMSEMVTGTRIESKDASAKPAPYFPRASAGRR